MTEQITISDTTAAPRKVYVQAFGRQECTACHRQTIGKLCDYVIGPCGGYFTNCVPLCASCWRRATKATGQSKSQGKGRLMIEQVTITIDKDMAQMLADFVSNHRYEWRRLYDDKRGLTPNFYFRSVPSLESRQAWLELVRLLNADSSIPITY